MSKPKKPLTKTESAIQLGNVLKFGTGGGGTLKSIFKTPARVLKRALKIKSKPTSSATKVKEVQTKPKKSLQNQKPDLSAKKEVPTRAVINKIVRIYNKGKKGKDRIK